MFETQATYSPDEFPPHRGPPAEPQRSGRERLVPHAHRRFRCRAADEGHGLCALGLHRPVLDERAQVLTPGATSGQALGSPTSGIVAPCLGSPLVALFHRATITPTKAELIAEWAPHPTVGSSRLTLPSR